MLKPAKVVQFVGFLTLYICKLRHEYRYNKMWTGARSPQGSSPSLL